jgi:nucleoside 2-deoxyribosyltransferase
MAVARAQHNEEHRSRTIFVAMPFKDEYRPVYEAIKESARLLNVAVVQVGEQHFAGSIISQIVNSIEATDLLVAIVSEENGNVYYEIGLAHCQAKPVVLLTSDVNALKFDLRDHRAIIYDPKRPEDIVKELAQTISNAIDTTADPHKFLASSFKGTSHTVDLEHRSSVGVEKAKQMLIQAASLQEPVSVTHVEALRSARALTIEVEDFFGKKVRAVIDINGIVRMKHYDR